MKRKITYIEETEATVYGSTLAKAYDTIKNTKNFPFLAQDGSKKKCCSIKISCSKRFIYLEVSEGLVDRESARLFLHDLSQEYLVLCGA